MSNFLSFLIPCLALCQTGQGFIPIVAISGLIESPYLMKTLCSNIMKYHQGQNCTVVIDSMGTTSTIPILILVERYRKLITPFFDENPNGIHVIAHSQGVLVARALIETTNNHPVKTFVSIAGPQMGQYGDFYGHYPELSVKVMYFMTKFMYSFGQDMLSIAGYWKGIKVYKDNTFGLKTLDERQDLIRFTVDADHFSVIVDFQHICDCGVMKFLN